MCSTNQNVSQMIETTLKISYEILELRPDGIVKKVKISVEGDNGNDIGQYLDKVIFQISYKNEILNKEEECSSPPLVYKYFVTDYSQPEKTNIHLIFKDKSKFKIGLDLSLGVKQSGLIKDSKIYRISHWPKTTEFLKKLLNGGGELVQVAEKEELEKAPYELEESTDGLEEATDQLDEATDEVEETTDKLEELTNELDKASCRIYKLLGKVEKLDREINDADENNKVLQTNLDVANCQINKLLGKVEKLYRELNDADDYNKVLQSNLDEANCRINKLLGKVDKLDRELNHADDNNKELKINLDEANCRINKLLEKVQNLETQLNHANDINKVLKKNFSKANHYNKELKKNLDKANQALKIGFHHERKITSGLKNQIKAEKLDKEESIKRSKDETSKAINELKEQLKEKSEQIEAEQLKIHTLTKDLEAKKAQLSAKINTIQKMKKDKQKVSKKSAKIILDLEAQNVENLKKMKDEHTVVTNKLQDDSLAKIKDLEEQFLEINNTLEQVLDDKEAKIRNLEKKILNEQHNKRLNAVTEELDTVKQSMASTQKELKNTKDLKTSKLKRAHEDTVIGASKQRSPGKKIKTKSGINQLQFKALESRGKESTSADP